MRFGEDAYIIRIKETLTKYPVSGFHHLAASFADKEIMIRFSNHDPARTGSSVVLDPAFVVGTRGKTETTVKSVTPARAVMLPNRLIVGWCLGVLTVSTAAMAKSSGFGSTGSLPAELFESRAASTSPAIPLAPIADTPTADTPTADTPTAMSPAAVGSAAVRVAQNASNRNHAAANIPNTANVSLQMNPDKVVSVGTKISFRVTTKKPGYLMLVDIDANGNMSQIFPSPEMIVQSQEAATNLIKPGEALLIPNSAAKRSGFEYVITPPTGEATLVAVLSDRPVQIIDLPDNTQKPRGEAETIGYLTKWTSELRVPDPGTGKLQPSKWSFDIKQYSIKP